MKIENQTLNPEFHFQPFTTIPEIKWLLFWTFLILYLLSLLGNGSVAFIIYTVNSLHTPMYFFLANLAFLEIAYSCSIAPLTLANLGSVRKISISLSGCGTQMFFFTFLGGSDCILLAIMAYDRCVAISHPLSYPLIMTWRRCMILVVGTWAMSGFLSFQLSLLILTLTFCGNNMSVRNFVCDFPALIKVACGDTHAQEHGLFIISAVYLTVPVILICISYIFITVAVLRIPSALGRKRAFSTCSSHIMVVLMQYSFSSLIYLCPASCLSATQVREVSVVYTFITPVLNPLIYSLRSKELKEAMNRTFRRIMLPQKK
ncbi:PREDICTED: olfactory receptor 10V1-like [Thamnophis sirtalis]|uniref:Olfactory receptor n=1 Tax=Thamnophis sirtalis TaxID=35019 RepID=A0A6I9X886_9SAUR|nr:PREDICTED: olfactory receptor 10V1-like [Thamnophis sirtalis]